MLSKLSMLSVFRRIPWNRPMTRYAALATLTLALAVGCVAGFAPTAHASIIPPGGGSGCQSRGTTWDSADGTYLFYTEICADGPHYYSNGVAYYNIYPSCWEKRDYYHEEHSAPQWGVGYWIACQVETNKSNPIDWQTGAYDWQYGNALGSNPAITLYLNSFKVNAGNSVQIYFGSTSLAKIGGTFDGAYASTLYTPYDQAYQSIQF